MNSYLVPNLIFDSLFVSDSLVNFYGNIGKTLLSLVCTILLFLIYAISCPHKSISFYFFWSFPSDVLNLDMIILIFLQNKPIQLGKSICPILVLNWFWWNIHLQVSISFDLLFILQHYVLYPVKKADPFPTSDTVTKEPLLKSSDGQHSENV